MSDQNSKIKILHLTNTIRRGGKERQIFTIYKNCPANIKNKVVSIHQSNSSYLDEYEVKDEDIYFLKTSNNLKRVWWFRKIAEHEKPDVVYAWDTLSYLIAVFAGFFLPNRIINGSIRHGIRSNNLAQYWRTFILHLSRNIVANSRAGLHANNLKRGLVLYNGISHKFFDPVHNVADKELDNISLKRPVFISVASLVPYKDYFTVIEALATLHRQQKQFTYLIVGDGPNREMINQQIVSHSMENKIHVLGAKVNVIDYLHKSDVFIHSSKGEGCSNAILEAMASGLPIIASATGGTPEIITPENGLLFEYKNVNQLTESISRLIEDKDMRIKMGKRSIDVVKEKYTTKTMTQNYVSIIEKVVNL